MQLQEEELHSMVDLQGATSYTKHMVEMTGKVLLVLFTLILLGINTSLVYLSYWLFNTTVALQ